MLNKKLLCFVLAASIGVVGTVDIAYSKSKRKEERQVARAERKAAKEAEAAATAAESAVYGEYTQKKGGVNITGYSEDAADGGIRAVKETRFSTFEKTLKKDRTIDKNLKVMGANLYSETQNKLDDNTTETIKKVRGVTLSKVTTTKTAEGSETVNKHVFGKTTTKKDEAGNVVEKSHKGPIGATRTHGKGGIGIDGFDENRSFYKRERKSGAGVMKGINADGKVDMVARTNMFGGKKIKSMNADGSWTITKVKKNGEIKEKVVGKRFSLFGGKKNKAEKEEKKGFSLFGNKAKREERKARRKQKREDRKASRETSKEFKNLAENYQ